jgi:tRNA(Leu) C34 or U34 (ribose-2'-O)-methylase TrmL
MKGYFGIGIYHPKTIENLGTLWRSAFLFGASFIFTIGDRYKKQASDTCKTWNNIPLWQFKTFSEFRKSQPKDSEIICVELNKQSINLKEFKHPKRAIYMLGAEDKGIPPIIYKKYITVVIPTTKTFSMNVATAGSIILYDRFIK